MAPDRSVAAAPALKIDTIENRMKKRICSLALSLIIIDGCTHQDTTFDRWDAPSAVQQRDAINKALEEKSYDRADRLINEFIAADRTEERLASAYGETAYFTILIGRQEFARAAERSDELFAAIRNDRERLVSVADCIADEPNAPRSLRLLALDCLKRAQKLRADSNGELKAIFERIAANDTPTTQSRDAAFRAMREHSEAADRANQAGDVDRAIAELEQAADATPLAFGDQRPGVLRMKLNLFLQVGRFDDVAKLADQAYMTFEDDAQTMAYLGEVFGTPELSKRCPGAADRFSKRAEELAPRNAPLPPVK